MPASRRQVLGSILFSVVAGSGCGRAAEQEALLPEGFGAKGDGRTDDTTAFQALSRALAQQGGGRVRLRGGATYRVGRQSSAVPGRGLTAEPILHAQDVATFIVELNGATLKLNDGLKFGSFDPRTGSPLVRNPPSVDRKVAADLGYLIRADNVRHFEVAGGTLDMNSAGAVVGGPWGDTGWQLPCYGVVASECGTVVWQNIVVKNSCLDGFLYTYSGPAVRRSYLLTMEGCTADAVARNCMTITGCKGALVQRCRFSRAGEAPGGPRGTSFGSKPRSCFDVEAEGPVCRNVVIRDCDLVGSPRSDTAFVADSGDSADLLIEDSRLTGTVWTSKPRTVIRNCRINGHFGHLLAGQRDPSDNTVISGCRISDLAWPTERPTTDNVISGEGAGGTRQSPLVVRDSTFDIHFYPPNLRYTRLENVTINIHAGTKTISPSSYVMFLGGATIRGLRIVDQIPDRVAPAIPYYVHEASLADVRDAELVSPKGHILWNAPSRAAGGYTGRFRQP